VSSAVISADPAGEQGPVAGPSTPVRPPASSVPHPYAVVHALPGRVRLRLEVLKHRSQLAPQLASVLLEQPGIVSVRSNTWCASMVIVYDADTLSLQEVERALRRAVVTPLPPARIPPAPAPPAGRLARLAAAVERVAPPWAQLAISAGALAASLLGLPAVVAAGLAAAAVVPMLGRALGVAAQERRAGVDALDSTAAMLLISQRNLAGASLMATLIGLGEFIRARTARRSAALMADLLGLAGRSAWVVHGNRRMRVPAEQVTVGATVVVYPGDMVPVDGIVRTGRATVDQRSLTGETMPVELGPGDRAYAATVLLDGKLYLECRAAGAKTRAGVVVDLVQAAPLYETRSQNHAARMADRLVVPTFLLAGLGSAVTGSLTRAASILIVDFATGIRIAAPTAVLASMQRAARRGILIKGGAALEKLASVDAVLFDKTGTLTQGEPEVTEVAAVGGWSPEEMLTFAAAAEQRLRHPTARAIVRHARRAGLTIPDRAASAYSLGLGVQAEVCGRTLLVGSGRWLGTHGVALAEAPDKAPAVRLRGDSLSLVAIDGELAGLITYRDALRPDAAEVVAGLRRRGVRDIVMVTGDNTAAAQAAAAAAGIDQVVAGVFPEQKVEVIQGLQAHGRTVAVVGDGINDSPALAYADVAIAMHGGADVARERADVVLSDDSLLRVPEAIDIARAGMGLVRQGYVVVGGSNAVGLVLAATGLIGPTGATLANNGTAVLAALNSLRPLLSAATLPLDNGDGG
jgi:heavy metal translocating P-type ATPase